MDSVLKQNIQPLLEIYPVQDPGQRQEEDGAAHGLHQIAGDRHQKGGPTAE